MRISITTRLVLVAAMAFPGFLGTAAQTEPQDIKPYVIQHGDSTFYEEQVKAWQLATQQQPTSQRAWRNLYKAAKYRAWYLPGDTATQQILQDMRTAIPGTYTYYYCAYHENQGSEECRRYAEMAMELLPEKPAFEDYDLWVCYLMMFGQDKRFQEMARRYYESGLYAPSVLQYSYNELQGMDDFGIFVGNGDATIIPKWLLQQGKDVHKDKFVLCYSFLMVPQYRDWVFKTLNIGTAPAPEQPLDSNETIDAYCTQLVNTIHQRSGRTLYFSPLNGSQVNGPWAQKLYNEGLVMRYADRPYDNLSVKRRNVEDRYFLEYLLESFQPDTWDTSSNLSANYAVMLADLLPYYKKHDRKRHDRLLATLRQAVNGTRLSQEKKQEYLQLLVP